MAELMPEMAASKDQRGAHAQGTPMLDKGRICVPVGLSGEAQFRVTLIWRKYILKSVSCLFWKFSFDYFRLPGDSNLEKWNSR